MSYGMFLISGIICVCVVQIVLLLGVCIIELLERKKVRE